MWTDKLELSEAAQKREMGKRKPCLPSKRSGEPADSVMEACEVGQPSRDRPEGAACAVFLRDF